MEVDLKSLTTLGALMTIFALLIYRIAAVITTCPVMELGAYVLLSCALAVTCMFVKYWDKKIELLQKINENANAIKEKLNGTKTNETEAKDVPKN